VFAVNDIRVTLLAAGQGDLTSMIPMLGAMVAMVYFMIIRPQKRETDEREQMHAGLKKNDKVLTTGGIIGTIVALKDDVVTLRVDDKVKIQFAKNAIIKVMGADAETPSEPEPTKS
jgi:preprotein translocase subunit YajC